MCELISTLKKKEKRLKIFASKEKAATILILQKGEDQNTQVKKNAFFFMRQCKTCLQFLGEQIPSGKSTLFKSFLFFVVVFSN